MTYAAYLRIYEPVAAFHEPDRSRWAAYAASPARPRRRDSLTVEHAEALRRAIAAPQVVVPDEESEHAYVRRADGVTYVCPWQTRLRCLLSYGRMISATGSALPGLVLARDEQQTMNDLTRLADAGRWLEDFHPYSLVELDYGGLVHLLSDEALGNDQSAAEIGAAIDGVAKGERGLAAAMYKRAHSRWRACAEYEMAN